MAELRNFRQFKSQTAGHPEYGHTAGVETTTGPLGQGIANAVGMAIAQKMLATRFGEELFSGKIYVTVGDGCLMEGISHEAFEIAGYFQLDNLVFLFDDNNITIDGKTDISSRTNVAQRIASYGFATFSCDGHNHKNIRQTLAEAVNCNKPAFIACKTTIGYGSPSKAGTSGVHGSPLGEAETQATRQALGWNYKPFEIPPQAKADWEKTAKKGIIASQEWQKKYNLLDTAVRQRMEKFCAVKPSENGGIPKDMAANLSASLAELKELTAQDKPNLATRKASGNVLDVLTTHLPQIVSGSADLTPSVNTFTSTMRAISPQDFSGNFIHYGVREHAMAAIMNGLALCGFIPVSGTFMSFVDYFKPALRLSALMGLRTIHVLTHDSIGLGEDGPTHQPVEQLAMLRAMPNSLTFRPADQIETTECWQLALQNGDKPSVLSLSRQNLPTLRRNSSQRSCSQNSQNSPNSQNNQNIIKENFCSKGGYIIAENSAGDANDKELQGVFIATGSELHLAVEAHKKLLTKGINTRVVSMPCWELFEMQSQQYKDSILPPQITARVALEAGSRLGWDKYIGSQGRFIGMENPDINASVFGASAPAPLLYQHFGITAENAVAVMLELV